jgi:hypothetical protein
VLVPWPGPAASAAQARTSQDLTAAIRGSIEAAYRKNNGIGFKAFDCDAPPLPLQAGQYIDCDAVDDEGDAVRYTLEVGETGSAEIVLVSQPAAGLTAEARAQLEPPCRAFLQRFDGGDWKAAYADLHPALRKAITAERMKADLSRVRDSLGAVRTVTLRTYALRVPDRHELEYVVTGERGAGVARFRVAPGDDGARITAFLVTPAPGSPLHSALLSEALGRMLSARLGQPIAQLNVPIDRLSAVGAVEDGTATLASGRRVAVEVRRTGRDDDFDTSDYSAAVLDVPFLVERFLATKAKHVDSVDCPERTLDDGRAEMCRATVDGTPLAVTIVRREGDHRILSVKPTE